MALTGWSSANYLIRTAAVRADYPVLISAWAYKPSGASSGAVVHQYFQNTNAEWRSHLGTTGASEQAQVAVRASNSFGVATSVAVPEDAWFHLMGNFVSTALRECLLDGADKASGTDTRDPTGTNRTAIGLRPLDPSEPWPNTGAIAEVSFWDGTGIDATNRDALAVKLAAGEVPTEINAEIGQPWTGKLVCYVLDEENSLTDLSGNGHDFTMQGTLTAFGSHPPVSATDPGDATAAVTLPMLQIDADATVDVGASASVTLPQLQTAAAGTVDIDGAASITLPRLQVSTASTLELTGTGNITLPMLAASGAGVLGALAQPGRSIHVVVPRPEKRSRVLARKHGLLIQLVGYQSVVEGEATASVTLPMLAVSGQGSVAISGTAAITLPLLQAFGAEEAGVVPGAASVTLPRLQVSAQGAVGVAGTSAIALPLVTITAATAVEVGAVGAITLPLLMAAAAGQQGAVNDEQLVAHHHAGPFYAGRRL